MESSPIDHKQKFTLWLAADLFKLSDELAALTVSQRHAMLANGIPHEMVSCAMEVMFYYRKAIRGEKIGPESEGDGEAAPVATKAKRAYTRKAPTESATQFEAGHEQLGQDGKTMYRVSVMPKGSKRWTIVRQQ